MNKNLIFLIKLQSLFIFNKFSIVKFKKKKKRLKLTNKNILTQHPLFHPFNFILTPIL